MEDLKKKLAHLMHVHPAPWRWYKASPLGLSHDVLFIQDAIGQTICEMNIKGDAEPLARNDLGWEFTAECIIALVNQQCEGDFCKRCGGVLECGYCTDDTCAFADHLQFCNAGWAGHEMAIYGTDCSCSDGQRLQKERLNKANSWYESQFGMDDDIDHAGPWETTCNPDELWRNMFFKGKDETQLKRRLKIVFKENQLAFHNVFYVGSTVSLL